jgi:hypothetical protein
VIEAYSVGGDGTARFSLRSEGSGGIPGGPLTGRWDVRLTPAVPIALSVDSPVSGSHIDLSQLDVTTIDIKAGVGQMVLSLPATGTLTGKIECGVGQTRLLVPRSVRAVLRVEAGLGTVAVPPGYTRTGDVYVSPVAASTASIQLDVHGGVGAIDVEEKP